MNGKKSGKRSSVKKKSLFDHINQITGVQNPNYWEEISEEDKKSWSNYMVHRFLSMKTEWIGFVNQVQKYTLNPKDLYKLYVDVIPKKKQWLRYVKKKKEMDFSKEMLEVVSRYFEVGLQEAQEMVELYFTTNKDELRSILEMYGNDKKEINKWLM